MASERGYPVGILLKDVDGSGYTARVGVGFDDLRLLDGSTAGEHDRRHSLLVRARRLGRVVALMPDMTDPETVRILADGEAGRDGMADR